MGKNKLMNKLSSMIPVIYDNKAFDKLVIIISEVGSTVGNFQ